MNFDCVSKNEKGTMNMKFHKPFTVVEKIQLLQRSILVNSFAYYELNDNILSDFQYDANALQLAKLAEQYPEEYERSRYFRYFKDFCSDGETHNTTGFDLLSRVKRADKVLYGRLHEDASLALKMKGESK